MAYKNTSSQSWGGGSSSSTESTLTTDEEKAFLHDLGFDITDHLRSGSFGDVFKGVCNENAWDLVYAQDQIVAEISLEGRLCAIKRIRKSGQWTDDLFNEVQAHLDLAHPNIVKIYGVFKSGQSMAKGYIYIVMEYLNVGTLKDLLKNIFLFRNLDEYTALRVIRDVSAGLHYLHNQDLVHADLHSENIMIAVQNNRMVCKIVDLGRTQAKTKKLAQYDIKMMTTHLIHLLDGTVFQSAAIKAEIVNILVQAKETDCSDMNEVANYLAPYLTHCDDDPPPKSIVARYATLYPG